MGILSVILIFLLFSYNEHCIYNKGKIKETSLGVRDVTSIGTSRSAIKLQFLFYKKKVVNCVRDMQSTAGLLKMFYSHLKGQGNFHYQMTFELGIEDG